MKDKKGELIRLYKILKHDLFKCWNAIKDDSISLTIRKFYLKEIYKNINDFLDCDGDEIDVHEDLRILLNWLKDNLYLYILDEDNSDVIDKIVHDMYEITDREIV